jgi:hypothetical protein
MFQQTYHEARQLNIDVKEENQTAHALHRKALNDLRPADC